MSLMKKMRRSLARGKRYRQTITELSRLTDRELHDIGIARCDIKFVARQHRDMV